MTEDKFRYEPFKPTPAPEPGTIQFWADIEVCEAEPWNATCADKLWVERLLRESKTWFSNFVFERPTPTEFVRLIDEFEVQHVQALVIGVHGADLHARRSGAKFLTTDVDFFLPRDAANLVRAWEACTRAGFSLWCRDEPLDSPRDLELAVQVVATRSLTVARGASDGRVDLTFVMGSLDFEDVWLRRRVLREAPDVWVDVARLEDILRSKRESGRTKDVDFLRNHDALLQRLLEKDGHEPHADQPLP